MKARTKQFEINGIVGEGKTLTEAKNDAKAKACQFLTDAVNGPYIKQIDDYTMIVYRCYDSWAYRLIGPKFGNCECLTSANQGKAKTIAQARMHLAQTLSTIDCVRTDIVETSAQATELLQHFDWQKRYAEFKALGHSDSDCHRLACGMSVSQVA